MRVCIGQNTYYEIPEMSCVFLKQMLGKKTGKKFCLKCLKMLQKEAPLVYFSRVFFENGKKTIGTCIPGSIYVFC